jgi:hypothetical protein
MVDDGTCRESQDMCARLLGCIHDSPAKTARLAAEVVAAMLSDIGRPALCFMGSCHVSSTVAYIQQVLMAVGGNVDNVTLAEAEATGYACRDVDAA